MEIEEIQKGLGNLKKENSNMKLVEKYSNIEYLFQFKKENAHIHFTLKEKNVYVPFTYEGSFAMEDFIEKHIAFKSCDDLDELIFHLNNLYNSNKIKLFDAGSKSSLQIFLTAWNIAEELESEPFELTRIMTEDKDQALFELYNIQKHQLKLIEDIKIEVNKNLSKENPLYKEINKILNK